MRNLKRIIYTSSYDRGLEHLLKMWADIKKEVPEVELHIFYGWQIFDELHRGNPGSVSWKDNINKLMQQDGITDHGRVAQPLLVDEYKKSGIWAYPTHFGEINCISAIKAQAYGCEPVVMDYAALHETVQFGRKIPGDIYDRATQEEFKKALIEALQKPMSAEKRKEMSEWAFNKYAWEKIAKEWEVEFNHE